MNIKRNKLQKISQMLKHMENNKIRPEEKLIKELLKELNEEEKMSKFYLQVTSNTAYSERKKAMFWNKVVLELKQRLFAIKIQSSS